jgi:hypothetical protein
MGEFLARGHHAELATLGIPFRGAKGPCSSQESQGGAHLGKRLELTQRCLPTLPSAFHRALSHSAETLVKEARKNLRSKNQQVASNTVRALEAAVKNCGPNMHRCLAQKDNVDELVKLIRVRTFSHLDAFRVN